MTKFFIKTIEGDVLMSDDLPDFLVKADALENYLSAHSEKMKEVVAEIRLYAPLDLPVVIEGESGTGKEMISKALHALSGRATSPFVVINMGEGPETLFESALFGHCKGAFTGADQNRIGYMGQAKDGTIFMDEINSLPLSLQPKLLRVLEYGTYWPVGSTRFEKTRARFIFSSNQSLNDLRLKGYLREDIFYRLGRILRVPPLRERQEDIPLLADHLIYKATKKISGGSIRTRTQDCPKLTTEGLHKLFLYRWPGNVRQLKMVLERAVLVCNRKEIRPEDVDLPYEQQELEDYSSAMEKFSKNYFSRVRNIAGDNIKTGMNITGMTETTYRRKMRKFGK